MLLKGPIGLKQMGEQGHRFKHHLYKAESSENLREGEAPAELSKLRFGRQFMLRGNEFVK